MAETVDGKNAGHVITKTKNVMLQIFALLTTESRSREGLLEISVLMRETQTPDMGDSMKKIVNGEPSAIANRMQAIESTAAEFCEASESQRVLQTLQEEFQAKKAKEELITEVRRKNERIKQILDRQPSLSIFRACLWFIFNNSKANRSKRRQLKGLQARHIALMGEEDKAICSGKLKSSAAGADEYTAAREVEESMAGGAGAGAARAEDFSEADEAGE
jgi:hypothetical protein